MPGSRSIHRPCVSSMSSRSRCEDVEDEEAAGQQQIASSPERAEPGRRVGQMQVRPERTGHERDALADRRIGDVAQAKVEQLGDTGLLCPAATDLQHPGRRVDADDGDAGSRRRHRDPARADAELHDRPAGLPRLRDVERHVLGHAQRPRVVELGDRVVDACPYGFRATHTNSLLSSSNGRLSNQP